MLRFIFNRRHPSADRHNQHDQLYKYSESVQHGFPSRPSALAHDAHLSLIAIGTKHGCINVYGQPGVEFYGQHDIASGSVRQIVFLPGQGRLVTHCENNSLHLWRAEFGTDDKPTRSVLTCVASLSVDDERSKVSTLCLDTANSGTVLLLGTEGGNIYTVTLDPFQFAETVVHQEVVMHNVPECYKVNPGAVECVSVHPVLADKLLIGFNRGLMVVFDRRLNNAERTYVCNQSLETVCWSRDGALFMSAHNDGSYIVWNAEKLSKPDGPHTPYGPFPCKSITGLTWCTTESDGDWVVFAGGMPRASYGDKYTVSVIRRDRVGKELKHVAFEFTSSVVDFCLLHEPTPAGGSNSHPHSLLVLAEEELVCVDLGSPGWPLHRLPYLNSVHSSAVTATCYVSQCSSDLLRQLQLLGQSQEVGTAAAAAAASGGPGEQGRRKRKPYSDKPWPIGGGRVVESRAVDAVPADLTSDLTSDDLARDLLLTGHEDGSVRVWLANGRTFRQLCKIGTGCLFGCGDLDDTPAVSGQSSQLRSSDSQPDGAPNQASGATTGASLTHTDDHHHQLQQQDDEEEEDMFPPLRAVGQFDPFSDDPRLAVKRLAFCRRTGDLFVGGTAGQVMLWSLTPAATDTAAPATDSPLQPFEVDLVREQDGFVWKGCDKLTFRRQGLCQLPTGGSTCYRPQSVVQLLPPATISAANLQSSWGLFAVGTGHGFVLFDYLQNNMVMHKCTLHPNDYAAIGETPMTRNKSLKKSLRESFRRLRRGRSQRARQSTKATVAATAGAGAGARKTTGSAPSIVTRNRMASRATCSAAELSPMERAVEARSEDPAYSSMVRCLSLVDCFVANNRPSSRTLWAGTNSGAIYVFILHCAERDSDTRLNQPVLWEPGRELRLKHAAPVLSIHIIDETGASVLCQSQAASAKTSLHSHRVLITSEEQFKIFSLPTLRPLGKHKLTALEGSRIRRVGYARFAVDTTATAAGGGGDGAASSNNCSSQWCVVTGTSQGELQVFSLPDLQRHLHCACLRADDIQGITSMMFSDRGEALFALSSSLYQRVSLSTAVPPSPCCSLLLTDAAAKAGDKTDANSPSSANAQPGNSQQNDTSAKSANGMTADDATATTTTSAAATSAAAAAAADDDDTEVVEISSEEARRLLNGMQALANGGAQQTQSSERYSEQVDGVTKSVETTKHSQMSATEDPRTNSLVAEQNETEMMSSGVADNEGGTRRQMKILRTTRITTSANGTQV